MRKADPVRFTSEKTGFVDQCFYLALLDTYMQACAEHLVSSKYTTPSNMGLHVSSAGGLLAGVMANTRPDLFSAMVMKAGACLIDK